MNSPIDIATREPASGTVPERTMEDNSAWIAPHTPWHPGARPREFGYSAIKRAFGAAFGHVLTQRVARSDEHVLAKLTRDLASYARRQFSVDLCHMLSDIDSVKSIAARSYKHGNGFTKVVLCSSGVGKLRMHIWEPGCNAEENIHEHRWHFASVVLTGAMTAETWVDAFDPSALSMRELIYDVDDKGGHTTLHEAGRSRIRKAETTLCRAGSAYSMAPGVLHRITSVDGLTATLVFTTAPSRSWNRMLIRDGVEPAIDRHPLQAIELQHVLNRLCVDLRGGASDVLRT